MAALVANGRKAGDEDRSCTPTIAERTPQANAPFALPLPRDRLAVHGMERPALAALQGGEFFRGLSNQIMMELVPLAPLFCCPGNTVLFAEEQPPRAVLLLLEGKVKLCMNSIEGRRLILGIVGPGEILGLASAVSGSPQASPRNPSYPA